MSVQVVYKNKSNTSNTGVVALFIDQNNKLKAHINTLKKEHFSYLSKILAKKKKNTKRIFLINLDENTTAVIISLRKNEDKNELENLGAKFFDFLKENSIDKISIFRQSFDKIKSITNLFDNFVHGLKLKSYEFNTYKSKKTNKKFNIEIIGRNEHKNLNRFKALEEGIFYTRDLVSEPGNILHPDEYAKRLVKLRKYGLDVKIYDERKLKKLGCRALLGVGQGSVRGSYLVTLEWKGLRSKNKPLSFVGKGVCFDTGGISLKPAKFMEDMTYDMAGSAVVVGLMKNLALRKAKINAVGVVGLVENMPGGNAQRPGDIVKSHSGKTIEILNTDAEGRLVLADAMSFTEKKFKPSLMIDLATLTGAIIVSLGSEYAGLFSNNDKLSEQLYSAGLKVDEKVWRMPLHKNYDKLINSNNADMQNINYVGGAGSTTAAQFLQRFVSSNTPWAHLDIAGMAFSKYGGALNPSGATGYGVRLLNKFIEDYYE